MKRQVHPSCLHVLLNGILRYSGNHKTFKEIVSFIKNWLEAKVTVWKCLLSVTACIGIITFSFQKRRNSSCEWCYKRICETGKTNYYSFLVFPINNIIFVKYTPRMYFLRAIQSYGFSRLIMQCKSNLIFRQSLTIARMLTLNMFFAKWLVIHVVRNLVESSLRHVTPKIFG